MPTWLTRSPRPALIGVAAAVAALAVVAACGSSKASPQSPTSSSGGAGSSPGASASAPAAGGGSTATSKAVTVDVKNFAFAPAALTVSVGTKVTWKFDDSTGHTVKADNGAFMSSTLDDGQTFAFTFNSAGTYSYICSIHPFMKGSVVVK